MSHFPPSELTPRQIVAELDKFIVGQKRAKRVVAIALRNRARRRLLEPPMRDEVMPKNILMIGPTGVGKTEIARRLAKLVRAPFVKVEATKYTEVGYVGRDVESMVRDLADTAVRLVKEEKTEALRPAIEELVLNRILDMREPVPHDVRRRRVTENGKPVLEYELPPIHAPQTEESSPAHRWWRKRETLKQSLVDGKLNDEEVEITVTQKSQSPFNVLSMPMGPGGQPNDPGMEQLQGLFDQFSPKKEKKVRVRIAEARKVLFDEEVDALVDFEKIKIEAIERTQQDGIIFIDELDKIASAREMRGPDVSREGVQRDILPIVEGSTVQTRHGMVATDHILFIAAGAFHVSKPSDLIPELQGRFPLRVELEPLTADDFERILTEPDNALTRQYTELLRTEGVEVVWERDGIAELAHVAAEANSSLENIGARRLHTILEKILEDVSFESPDMGAGRIVVDRAFVRLALGDILKNQDLGRYIL